MNMRKKLFAQVLGLILYLSGIFLFARFVQSFNWDYPYFSVSMQYLELTLALFIIGFALILAGISFPENREIGPEEENQTSASPVAER